MNRREAKLFMSQIKTKNRLKVKQRLTYSVGPKNKTVDLYSPQGLQMMSQLWIKVSTHFKLMYDATWMGRPIIQLPEDILMMQELIWRLKPDVIVECGIAHGGSLLFYASLCELMGKGRVIGVDIEIRPHNRVAIDQHPMRHRVDMIEGSSIAREIFDMVKKKIKRSEKVLVVLDSNHSRDHVLKEIQLYSDLVSKESYLVVMDGAQGLVWDIPLGKREWKEDNPLNAIEEFLKNDKRFVIDPYFERLKVTANPKGFLRRVT